HSLPGRENLVYPHVTLLGSVYSRNTHGLSPERTDVRLWIPQPDHAAYRDLRLVAFFAAGFFAAGAGGGFFVAGRAFSSTNTNSKGRSPTFSGRCAPAGYARTSPALKRSSSVLPLGNVKRAWPSVR